MKKFLCQIHFVIDVKGIKKSVNIDKYKIDQEKKNIIIPASASTSMVTTPQVGGRTTRSSLSQSSIESPTVRSPRNPRPGVPVTKQPGKKVPTTTSVKPEQTTASRRVARGGNILSMLDQTFRKSF
jgi:hypothetical protein